MIGNNAMRSEDRGNLYILSIIGTNRYKTYSKKREK